MGADTPDRSDAQLVATVAEGDAVALAELYDRYGNAVFRAAFRRLGDRQMAEEVLQDTYMALWQRAELFDPRRGSLLAWLSTIARNRAVDRLRYAGRRMRAVPIGSALGDDENDDRGVDRLLIQGTLLGSGASSVDPQHVLDDVELGERIRAALARIPDVERRVLRLAYYEELTQSEIAACLGWPLGTVKTRTRRALYRLRAVLADLLGPDLAPDPPAERRARLNGVAPVAGRGDHVASGATTRDAVDGLR